MASLTNEIARLKSHILKLRTQLYGSKSERSLPSDPNGIQPSLQLFSDEKSAAAGQNLRQAEKE